jgi:predicted DCC family thiol-disulfide oxidoreductase YuxK
MTSDKIIIYDDSCPLCCWYTDAFVSTGLLKKENRLSFSQLPDESLIKQLDIEKSKDEIPLLDSAGGPTIYGIDSLLEILGSRWPWMKTVAHIGPINWFLKRLYKLVSYNRRVIVATPSTPSTGFDCTPHFNLFYRCLYLTLALVIGGGSIAIFLLLNFPPFVTWSIGTGILLLLLAGADKPFEDRIHYWGVMVTPLLLMGLMLLPALLWPGLKLVLGLPAAFLGGRMLWRRWHLAERL